MVSTSRSDSSDGGDAVAAVAQRVHDRADLFRGEVDDGETLLAAGERRHDQPDDVDALLDADQPDDARELARAGSASAPRSRDGSVAPNSSANTRSRSVSVQNADQLLAVKTGRQPVRYV